VLNNLPQDSMEKQTTHYALGAASYAGSGGVLPQTWWDSTAELRPLRELHVAIRTGNAHDHRLPNAAMAAAQETKIRDYLKAGNAAQPLGRKRFRIRTRLRSRFGAVGVGRRGERRCCPDESHKLISMVHYDADITSIPGAQGDSDVSKTAKLLMGIAGSSSLAEVQPFCWDFFWAAGGRFTAWPAEDRSLRYTKRSSSGLI